MPSSIPRSTSRQYASRPRSAIPGNSQSRRRTSDKIKPARIQGFSVFQTERFVRRASEPVDESKSLLDGLEGPRYTLCNFNK